MAAQPEVPISPQEDARLPYYQNHVLHQWETYKPHSFREAKKQGSVERQVNNLALVCVVTLQRFQENGNSPDQGREAAQGLISDFLGL